MRGTLFRLLTPVFGVLLLSAGWAAARDLTFEERVEAQRAIERVYYSHQIGATLPFEDAVPPEVLEKKVRTYLKQSVALEKFWHAPVTTAMLQAEAERIARSTRMPDRLRELYTALDEDPVLVQECLVRPPLVERLARHAFETDTAIHAAARAEAEQIRRSLVTGHLDADADHPHRSVIELIRKPGAREAAAPSQKGATRLDLAPEEFTAQRRRFPRRLGEVSPVLDEPERFVIRVVLEEDEAHLRAATYAVPRMTWDSWWDDVEEQIDEATSAIAASPAASLPEPTAIPGGSSTTCPPNDFWDNQSLGQPTAEPTRRAATTAIWTGSLVVVWGGVDLSGSSFGRRTNAGERYDPATDTWAFVSTTGAPSGRVGHTAIWTGSRMIIWGGLDGNTSNIVPTSTGASYDPVADTWTDTSTANAPPARAWHTAVWTGKAMIVWGAGRYDSTGSFLYMNTGGAYDPATDTWTSTSTTDAPSPRRDHTAVWTGSQMVVWGGWDGNAYLDTGGRYDPSSDTWAATTTNHAPAARARHVAVWTGSEVVVLEGGNGDPTFPRSFGRYNPKADNWQSTVDTGFFAGRDRTAVWTGSRVVVWGGLSTDNRPTNSGFQYDPQRDRVSELTTIGAPPARSGHAAVWTGTVMVVVGGEQDVGRSYGRYDPSTDAWIPSAPPAVPSSRSGHTAVWTGNAMIVWGGSDGGITATGSRYDPVMDNWSALPLTGAPSARADHTAIWTGHMMIVWGGTGSLRTGGRYDPITDSWSPTSPSPIPGRLLHTAVWTGSRMLIWGGAVNDRCCFLIPLSDGAAYDPQADTWTSISGASAPSRRYEQTAVWTGSRMIIWGGCNALEGSELCRNQISSLGTGGQYDPSGDTWTATSTANAPSARSQHGAVWTGTLMVVWGGEPFTSAGGRYDPVDDTWLPTTTIDAPTARFLHTTVWTGRSMLVWGGSDGGPLGTSDSRPLGTGGRYYPEADRWKPISSSNAPSARFSHTAVWTGGSMVVWGGYGSDELNTGGRYLADLSPDGDGDSFSICESDCDDANASVYPGAPQICDGLNDDCSDPGWPALPASESDADGDGQRICGGDCDDTRPAIYQGAPQLCGDGLNNDCSSSTWPSLPGTNEVDDDGDDLTECQGDCDDAHAAVRPGAPQVCDGLNDDCDDPSWPTPPPDERDADGDGHIICAGDCDDARASVYPGAPQICDGLNDNCSDPTWPAVPADESDSDMDGQRICAGDCDDTRPTIYGGAPQLCGDGLNNDCSRPSWPSLAGTNEFDDDGDGFTECGADCDDTRTSVYPGAPQICDGVNDDCSDPNWPALSSAETDGDRDGRFSCATLPSNDCNDTDARIWSAPGEVPALALVAEENVIWAAPDEPGGTIIWYDMLRATNPNDFVTSTVCVETNDGANTFADDFIVPAPGKTFYYLVRAENFCPPGQNQGPLGFSSSGELRTGRSCP